MANNTSIRYEEVKNSISVIKEECLTKMNNIFENFNSSMKRVGAQDVFVGDASESLQARYNKLSAKFKDFQDLVIRFANEFQMASESTARTEQKLSQDAQSLNGGN